MITDTFDSIDVVILDDPPDYRAGRVQTVWSTIRDRKSGLTQRESRRPFAHTLRIKQDYTVTLSGAAARAAMGVLRDLKEQPVICPLWPFLSHWSDRAGMPVTGGLMIVWTSDWSQWELYTDVQPGWPSAGDLVAPALWGHLAKNAPKMIGPDSFEWGIEFTEASAADYAVELAAATFAAGPQPAGYAAAPKLLPVMYDYRKIEEAIQVEINRESVGFGREHWTTFYNHEPYRGLSSTFTLRPAEAAVFLRFWNDIAAAGASFWAPGGITVARLTAPAAADDTELQVSDTAAVRVGDYLALTTPAGFVARKITQKGDDSITLDAAPGVELSVLGTAIFPLCLVRTDKSDISLNWSSPAVAGAELQWTEMLPEVLVPADETLGVTIGKLATRVILFHFARDLRNGTTVDHHYTSFERDLEWDGETWLSQPFRHGDITQSLNVEADGVEITSFNFSGNPLIDDVLRRAEAPLMVTIRHADFDGETLSNVSVVFTGTCNSFARDGNQIMTKARMGPGLFDSHLPLFIRGTICNHLRGSNAAGTYLISAGCGLLKANWRFTAEVAAPVSAAFPYTVALSALARETGPAPDYFADWFAGGWIEWGTGALIQRRLIIGSTTPDSGAMEITLQRYFSGVPLLFDPVTLYPGCDGLFATCKAHNAGSNPLGKFDNALNFGAEPFTPIGNPSTSGQRTLGTQGGKK